MKKIILVLFAVAIASVNISAQETQKKNAPKKSPEERAANITKRMTKELALTEDQQAKIQVLILNREKEREQNMNDRKADRDKMNAELKTILTPEQYLKLQQKREEGKKKREQKRKSGSNNTAPPSPVQK